MEEEIRQILEEIEARENCKILLAAVVGSRAWGVAAPDSDYDLRFLYCRTPQAYLRLYPLPDVIEEKREVLDREVDIEGWDVRKALKLLREGNPSLYEWFSSPLRYRDTPEADAIRDLLAQAFDPRKILHCYLGLANRVYKSFLQGETVAAKRYLHTVWCVLICRWTLDRGTPPPLAYDALMRAELDRDLVPVVRDLIRRRQSAALQGTIPRVEALHRYLDGQMAAIPQEIRERTWDKPNKIPWETLDDLFLQIILGGDPIEQ